MGKLPKRAGVSGLHTWRRTFITNLVRGGVNPRIVQKLARHSTISLTMDRYARPELLNDRAALDVLRTLDSGFRVVALSAGSNWEKLAAAAAEFRPSLVALAEAGAAGDFKARLAELSAGEAPDVELVCGEDAARKAAASASPIASSSVGARLRSSTGFSMRRPAYRPSGQWKISGTRIVLS